MTTTLIFTPEGCFKIEGHRDLAITAAFHYMRGDEPFPESLRVDAEGMPFDNLIIVRATTIKIITDHAAIDFTLNQVRTTPDEYLLGRVGLFTSTGTHP